MIKTEGIKQWAFSLCAAAVAGGVIELAAPEGKDGEIKKIIKTVVCVFFLICMTAPLVDLGIEKFFSAENTENIESISGLEGTEEAVLRIFRENIIKETEKVLDGFEIKNAQISTKVNIGEDMSISISEINLIIDKQYSGSENKIKFEIKEKFGVEANIGFKE